VSPSRDPGCPAAAASELERDSVKTHHDDARPADHGPFGLSGLRLSRLRKPCQAAVIGMTRNRVMGRRN
jgi:hypothetical protein